MSEIKNIKKVSNKDKEVELNTEKWANKTDLIDPSSSNIKPPMKLSKHVHKNITKHLKNLTHTLHQKHKKHHIDRN
jgi:hypothetical protein